MKIIGKKFDYKHGLDMATNCKKQGIRTQACFVIGHPNERLRDFFLSLRYMVKLTINGLDEIAIFIISPFSGSKLSGTIEDKIDNNIYSFSPSFRKGYIKFSFYRFIMVISFLITKLIFDPRFYIDLFKVFFNKKDPYIKLHNLLKIVKLDR